MKLLVSDYDGTLNPDCTHLEELRLNIKAIRNLKESGHKFMLSTGRNFSSIKEEIKKHNIPYDYLSCNDGAALFNENDELIMASYIDGHVLNDLIPILESLGEMRLYGVKTQQETLDSIIDIGIYTKFDYLKKHSKAIKEIIKDYPELTSISFPKCHFIENAGGKSRTIKILEELHDFSHIVTVGDDKNDLGMLQDYQGYKIYTSYPSLYFKKIHTTTSVKALVKKMI